MAEVQEAQLEIIAEEDNKANPNEHSSVPNERQIPVHRRWIRTVIYTFLVLSGQSVATMLGTLYYDKGGQSIWMATLMPLAGFPVLLPYYCIPLSRKTNTGEIQEKPPSFVVLASVYISLGVILAVNSYMYSVGLMYLPVSTYSLICASQLAFNAFFSFFINSQKFTPFIINSLVLLTISSTLLVFQNDNPTGPTGVSKGKYAIGFVCTVVASAGYGLLLSLQQLAFRKVVKSETLTAIINMIIYPSLVSSCAILVGLFVSREWKKITREMQEYELGKVAYVMNLVWIAIGWQIFNIGAVGLIYEASSLFSNAISVVGLPIVPILAVVVFHDKMDGSRRFPWCWLYGAFFHFSTSTVSTTANPQLMIEE